MSSCSSVSDDSSANLLQNSSSAVPSFASSRNSSSGQSILAVFQGIEIHRERNSIRSAVLVVLDLIRNRFPLRPDECMPRFHMRGLPRSELKSHTLISPHLPQRLVQDELLSVRVVGRQIRESAGRDQYEETTGAPDRRPPVIEHVGD